MIVNNILFTNFILFGEILCLVQQEQLPYNPTMKIVGL
jgi:hypothetical protein